jgi:bile acid-coenzyme A ligase
MDENTADHTATGPRSLGEELAGLAVADPDRPAVTFGDVTLSRAELEARTNRLARAYQALGVTPDSFVTIGLPNGIEFVEATIATWKVGATPQPISHRLPPVERQAIIELADPSLLVGVDRDDAGGRPSVPEGFEPDPGLSTGPLEPRIAASLKAPTSGGSTGRPKLIVSGSPAVLSGVIGMAALGRMRPDGVALCTGPLHHNGPFLAAFGALFIGSHVVVMPKFDAEQSLMLIERHRVDWMYAVPTMMLRIWRLPVEVRTAYDVSSLAAVLHLAAPCPEWLKREWIDWLGPERILELYAGTEAQLATFLDGTEWLAHPGSVGRPLWGELQIRDVDGNVLPPGEVGSVWMRGPDGAPSTYRYVGATAKADADGWETLGDVGRLDEDGYLYLADRDTDMILVGGSNVYPAEVEGALSEHPAVADVCVIGIPDDDLGNVPHAIISENEPVPDDVLRDHLRQRLSPYKIPRTFERVVGPLRDDAGKVRRSALRADRLQQGSELPRQ